MLRIAYLFERFPSFGQTFCYREVAELIRQGAEVSIFSIRRPTGEPAQDWDPAVVERVIYLPEEAALVREVERAPLPRAVQDWGRQTDFLRLYQAVYVGRALREAGIQRVHAHFAGMAARTAYWMKQFFGIEYSLTAHAQDIFAPRDFVVSLEKIFAEAKAIVTVSDFAAADLRRRFPREAARIHRVYNGIDPAQFYASKFSAAPPLILSIGRLIEKKGFQDLVEACGRLRRAGVDFQCEIIGEGPLAAELSGEVQLIGPRSQREIAARLAEASLFVLAARPGPDGDMDNLPTVIMEAMAAGLPVISTALAGIPEMVAPGVAGELVPPGDPAALAAAMQALISNPAKARALGARGRAVALEKFSVQKNVRKLAAILAG